MKSIHPIQLKILRKLLFSQQLRYSDTKPSKDMENNQFDFHLDQLIRMKHVIKADSFYKLTAKGKEYANRMDTDKAQMIQQAKISVFVAVVKTAKPEAKYLIYTRLKHPFYGCQGFLSGKVHYGESVTDAAQREFKEETNLEGTPQIVALKHYRIFHKETSELLEDKFMFFAKLTIQKASLSELMKANING